MAYDFKKMSDVALQDAITDNTNVYIEEDGKIKRVPASELGGMPKLADDGSDASKYVKANVDGNGYELAELNVAPPDLNAKEGEPGHVLNRTHYEEAEVVNEPLNITWDGNTDGLVSVGGVFCKVSDIVLTDDQLKLCTVMLSNGTTAPIVDIWDDAMATEDCMITQLVACSRTAGATFEDMTFPEKGIYFGYSGSDIYVSSLVTADSIEYTKTVVHKIDKKYLPDNIGGIKYVTISENDDGEYTSSATYEQISDWIKAGMDVKCVYGSWIASLMYSDSVSDISTYVVSFHHDFVAMDVYRTVVGIRIEESSVTVNEYVLALETE